MKTTSTKSHPPVRPRRHAAVGRGSRLALAGLLAGGSLTLSTCEMRSRESFVNGAKIWFAQSFFNPELFLGSSDTTTP